MWWKIKVSPKTDDRTFFVESRESNAFNDNKLKSDLSNLNSELQSYRDAALVASAASAQALSNLQCQFELATKLAAVESNFRITSEQNKSIVASSIANESLDFMLEKQRIEFELVAVNVAKVSNRRIAELTIELELSEKRFEDEIEARVAIERFTSNMTAEIAIQNMDEKLANQQRKYESEVFIANSKVSLAGAMQPLQSETHNKQALKEAEARIEAEALGNWIAKKSAKTEFDTRVQKMKLEFESAAADASNASELSIQTLKFKSQLASHFTRKQCDSRLMSERAVSEVAVKVAEKANAVMLAEQQFKYEKAANAAREAFKSSMDILQEDSQTIIDAFNVEMVAKDLKYVVAKLTADRLEQQILTDRLEQEAASATKESELLLSVCGNVAHDLKSPLFTLVLGVEGLRSSFPQLGEVLDTLESACAFMNAAISRTIDFTKASSGVGLNPCNTTFDLRLALKSPFKWMKAMLPQDGTITLQLDPLPKEIHAMIVSDQRWVEENLLCLLSNAVKYSSHGIIRTIVTLNGKMLRVTVEDNGVGIDDSLQATLFQQFSQVQRNSVGGAGLGLYSMSKRSDAIGGSCGMDNRTGGNQGSSFWFEVPYFSDTLYPLHNVEALHIERPKLYGKKIVTILSSNDLTAEILKPLRILVIDDSIAVVKMLSNKLKGCGHTVATAKDGAEGLEKMISMCNDLDLVIIDLQMPIMDGIEATRRFREWEVECHRSPILPIVCSSANCNGEAKVRAITAGIDSVLPKPFTMVALTDAFNKAYESSHIRAVKFAIDEKIIDADDTRRPMLI